MGTESAKVCGEDVPKLAQKGVLCYTFFIPRCPLFGVSVEEEFL